MKKRVLFAGIAALLLVFCACSSEKTAAGGITPPVRADGDPAIVGEWFTNDNDMHIDRYLYPSGNSITVFEDSEEEFWCFTGKYKLDEDKKTLDISKVTCYKYDDGSGEWEETQNINSENLTDFQMDDDHKFFTCNEQLMDQSVLPYTYQSGSLNLDVPNMDSLTKLIMDYMK